MHPHLHRTEEERTGHVITIADVGQAQAIKMPLCLEDGKKIAESLCWMVVIRKAVDYRYVAMLSQLEDMVMRKDARHDAVDITRQDTGYVRYAFPTTQLDF